RTIEFGAIDERSSIVADDGIGFGGLGPTALRQDFVLQAAGERYHSVLVFIGCQETLPLRLVGNGLLGVLLLHSRLGFALHVLQNIDALIFGHERLGIAVAIFEALRQNIG